MTLAHNKKGRAPALPFINEAGLFYLAGSLASPCCSCFASVAGLGGAIFAPDWLAAELVELGATPAREKPDTMSRVAATAAIRFFTTTPQGCMDSNNFPSRCLSAHQDWRESFVKNNGFQRQASNRQGRFATAFKARGDGGGTAFPAGPNFGLLLLCRSRPLLQGRPIGFFMGFPCGRSGGRQALRRSVREPGRHA
jgi:hypothetical protein